jgi:hypothetical protein
VSSTQAGVQPGPAPPGGSPPGPSDPTLPVDYTLVGAGDIGECGRVGAERTAALLDQIDGVVFTTGDHAYMNGTADEFARCYHPTWGRHRARTRPSPGNHDYGTPGAAGYFAYFGAAAAPPHGYYSFDLGPWHVVSLNTNVPVHAGSAQWSWLRADLTVHRTRCAMAYFHEPLFSSSDNGGSARQRDLWHVLHEFGVDIVVNGHDHVYERFAPQDPDGRPDPARGIRQFTVGTGGAKLYGFPRVQRNSEVRGSAWGVLRLTLRADEYAWEFVPAAGESFRDAGREACR